MAQDPVLGELCGQLHYLVLERRFVRDESAHGDPAGRSFTRDGRIASAQMNARIDETAHLEEHVFAPGLVKRPLQRTLTGGGGGGHVDDLAPAPAGCRCAEAFRTGKGGRALRVCRGGEDGQRECRQLGRTEHSINLDAAFRRVKPFRGNQPRSGKPRTLRILMTPSAKRTKNTAGTRKMTNKARMTLAVFVAEFFVAGKISSIASASD